MADRHPLQAGDVAPVLGDYNFSNEADRRDQNYHGSYPAADQAQSEGGPKFRVGSATPTMQAPWNTIHMDGDNNGMPAEVHELDMNVYGDCYDPTAPMRIRTVAPAENHWNLDSDFDGHRN